MFEGGSDHFKYAVPRGETHEDLLDCLAVASNVRDGPVSSQAYRMSWVPGASLSLKLLVRLLQRGGAKSVAFMGLIADHITSIKPFLALQPYPTLQLLHRCGVVAPR